MRLRSLIIDDDHLARAYLRDLLTEFCPGVDIIADMDSTAGAADYLKEHAVDVIFLDVEMPGQDGIAFVQELGGREGTQVIYITAHAEYAIPALRTGATDYLLKPLNKKEFRSAVARAENNLLLQKATGFASGEYFNQRIALHSLKGFQLVSLRDIISLEAESNYTIVHLCNGSQIVVSRSLIHFEKQLDSVYFFRIHKSTIINLLHFKAYHSEDGGFALLSDNRRLAVSRYRQQSFFRVIHTLTRDLKA